MTLLTAAHDKIRNLFPNWDSLPEDDRVEIRDLLANANRTYAHKKLVQVYGLACDSDTDGCNYTGNGSEPERR